MSDIRVNRWLHQSGTGGVYQDSTGRVGIGTSVPTSSLDVQSGTIKIGSNTLSSSGVSTFTTVNATTVSATTITGVTTAGITTAYIGAVNDGPISGARNKIINGDMRLDQRNSGASVTPTGDTTYTVDRWPARLSQASKYSVQQVSDAPAGFVNSLKITSLSSYSVTSTDYFCVDQYIEGLNSSDLAWGTASAKTVTLSFWVKSSLTGTFGGSVFGYQVGYPSYVFSYSISAANTWEYKTITISGPTSGTFVSTNAGNIVIEFSFGVGSSLSGTAGTWNNSVLYRSATGAVSVVGTNAATWQITGVQLESGTVATPFERRSFGQELVLCQRYYEIGAVNSAGGGASWWSGRVTGVTYARQGVSYKVTKRAVPGTITAITGDYGTFSSAAPTVNNSTIHGFAWYKLATGTSDDGYVAIDWYSSAEL